MSGKQRILVVDDTPTNIQILNDILKDNYIVSFAINGPDALALADSSRNRPDLILLDIMMPDMDGYEVCRRLKQNRETSEIPVIFITAMTSEEDEARGFAVGCVDYITKPVSPPVTLARIRTHLALKNAKKRVDRLLSKTLLGSMRMMTDVMAFVDPDHFRQSARLKRIAAQIGQKLALPNVWQIEIAATLSQLGRIAAPPDVLEKVKSCKLMTEKEQSMLKSYASTGRDLISHIPSMGEVAEIVGRQHDPLKNHDIKGWDYVTTASQIIKLVCAYDQLIHCGQHSKVAIDILESRPKIYSRELVGLLREVEQNHTGGITKTIALQQLKPGMVLMEDLACDDGVVLIRKYTELSEDTLHLLDKNTKLRSVMPSVRVMIPS